MCAELAAALGAAEIGGQSRSRAATGPSEARAHPESAGGVSAAAQVCEDEPLATSGTIAYVCDCRAGAAAGCQAGNDGNTGRSRSSSWQTLERARKAFSTMAPGDTLAFCRGGAFEGRDEPWFNSSCRSKRPCRIRDYAPPWARDKEPAPKVRAHLNITNPGNARHKEGILVSNLSFEGDGSGVGIILNNDTKDVLVCNVTVENYEIGVYVAGANLPDPGSDGLDGRIVLRGSRVLHNKTMGWLGSCDECRIEHNLFDHNGDANMFDHGIYLNDANVKRDPDYRVHGMRVIGNDIRHSAMGPGTLCKGAPIVVHGDQDDLVIRGNMVSEDLGGADGGCWGISVSAVYPRAVGFRNVVVADNLVTNVGNASIQLSSCQNCRVENNLIIQSQPAFGGRGILVQRHAPRGGSNLTGTAATVVNNTVFFSTSQPSVGITVGSEGREHVIAGNVIVQDGSGGLSCFSYELPAAAYTSDHNFCWDSNKVASWETRTKTLGDWRHTSGLDLHSSSGNPAFVRMGAQNYDFSPAPGSPLIDAGDPVHSPAADLRGRRRSAPPDAGALQHR